jgi:3-hydroxyisobutyrate dehydrogenase
MDKSKITVGWIGTGVMGKSMAGHLMNNGYSVQVHNRTKAKADALVEAGATYVENPIDIAKNCDFVFLMLGYPIDVEEMTLHPDRGILKHMKAGSYLIDHTTSSPGLAEKIAAEAKAFGVGSIDAPVSGGDIGAKAGKLVVMIGGEAKDVEACTPLMNCFAGECKLMGKPGAGQHTKMANQIMIASTMNGLCEALIYGHKAGLELD